MEGGATGTRTPETRASIDWRSFYAARSSAHHPKSTSEPAAEPLARNGYALIDDLATPRVRGLLAEMERFQAGYMATTRPLWAAGYKHTGDRLDNWSRRWEYPYCGWNLRDLAPGRVLDAGSGINFFPFWLARRGWQVTAADLNRGLAPLFTRANQLLQSNVRFAAAPIESLPFADGEFDAAYCVSVLEHSPKRRHAIAEFARVLAPGGRLTITWDVSLTRESDIKLEDVAVLLDELEQRFTPLHPLDLERPANLLTTERMLAGERWRLPWRPHPKWWRRTITRLRHGDPFRALAVMGTTWTKRG